MFKWFSLGFTALMVAGVVETAAAFQDLDGRVYTGSVFGNETITVGPYTNVVISFKTDFLDFPSNYLHFLSQATVVLNGDLTYVTGSAARGSAAPSNAIFTVNESPPACLTDADVIVQVLDISQSHWEGEFATIVVNSGISGGTVVLYDKCNPGDPNCDGRRPTWCEMGLIGPPFDDDRIWSVCGDFPNPPFSNDYKLDIDVLTVATQTGGGGEGGELEKPAVPSTWTRIKALMR